MARRASTPKYQPLADYLVAQPGERVTLTFAQLEALIGLPLPPSASSWGWWTNQASGHAQARAWLDAGWRRASVNVRQRWVVFERRGGATWP